MSWSVYYKAANELDSLDGKDAWRDAPGGYAASAVASASRQLAAAREAGDAEELTQLLRTMMMRNHLQVDLPQPHLIPNPNPKPNPDQVDLPQLHTECRVGTKHAIEAYDAEQVASLRWLAAAAAAAAASPTTAPATAPPGLGLDETLEFIERSKVCLGHTALCLSGGGALAMYHMGVIKALIENGAMPGIISGTSGGAIVAGVRGIHTSNPNPNPRCSAPCPNSLTPTLTPQVLGIHTLTQGLTPTLTPTL